MENWLAKHKNIFWNVYLIIIIIILLVFTNFVIKNVEYIKYSPCEACIEMGYSCSNSKISSKDISVDQAWEDVIKEKDKEVNKFEGISLGE